MMKHTKHTILKSLTAFAFAGTLLGSGIAAAEETETAPAAESDGAEIQTRGPVHEAFAGTVSFNPTPGLIVDKQPPELIEEIPPEQRLEGENVTWIPGYWAWDEDQDDFLWVSGIWRNLPPGRQWVPGYWADLDGRHQWTSGYWEDEATTEVSYLPEPPRTLEAGPNIKAPSESHSWIPGNWMWRNERYAWRTGYWAPIRENWSWTPAYYRWTHRGYVYVDGFWDYPVLRRGVVFAPVHFVRGYVFRPGFFYSPVTVISLSVFSNHLFLRPGYGHYYFGDYYEPRYRDRGFFASYSYYGGRRGFDPIFAHLAWENRNDRNWERGRREYFEFRRDHVEARPPRTWAILNSRPPGDRERGDFGIAERFDRVVGNHGEGQRFQAVDKQDRERFLTQRQEIRKFGQDRAQLETHGVKPVTDGKNRPQITREKINRSPVVSKNPDPSSKDGGPPERLQARASEKDEPTGKNSRPGNGPKADGGDQSMPNRKKDGVKPHEDGSSTNGKTEQTPEHRTKPGQNRDNEPAPDHKTAPDENRASDPNKDRKSEPTPEHRTKPGQRRDAEPAPDHKMKPDENRAQNPNSGRKADPSEQRAPDPNRGENAKPEKKHTADSDPARKMKPEANGVTTPPGREVSKEHNTQGELRRTEKKPKVLPEEASRRVIPEQSRHQETPPSDPQRTHVKKNQDPTTSGASGLTEEEKKRRAKKLENAQPN